MRDKAQRACKRIGSLRYVYNTNGQLAKQYAVENGSETESYIFEYDSLGRLIRSREEGGSGTVQRTEHLYDSANRLTAQNWSVGTKGFSESYSYRANDGALESVTLATGDTVNYHYDDLKRADVVTTKNSNNTTLLTQSLSYLDYDNDSTRTTSRLGEYTVKDASNNAIVQNRYEYDANGNITKIKEAYSVNSTAAYRDLAVYVYDSLNQLEYETRYTYTDATDTPATTTTIHYTIDTAGNIRSVTTTDNNGTATVAYTYGNTTWADLLTAYDGHAIAYEGQTYDALTGTVTGTVATGNPINWYNGNSYTDLTWTQGRRLSSITKGSNTFSYKYDMSGIRTVKIADGLKHEYVTQNGKVVRETVTNASTGAFVRCLDFIYDDTGKPFAMRKYRDSSITSYDTFHYVTNAQGDVIQLNFQGGTVYAQYSYDAWGNILSATGSYAEINPLRYRGYYFDTETGFYYLQSRYYDPIVKRFLNADSYGSTGQGFLGYNMFAYCANNPISNADSSGSICVCVSIADGGGSSNYKPSTKTCSSGATHGGSKASGQNPGRSDEEKLFQTYYKNTYGHYYSSPCGSTTEISFYIIEEYTKKDQDRDAGIIGGVFGLLGYKLGLTLLGSGAFGFGTGYLSNRLLHEPHPEKKMFSVVEWEWRNDAFGRSRGRQYGAKYEYELNANMTLTLVGSWHIEPNPYYDPNYYWNANGDHWG